MTSKQILDKANGQIKRYFSEDTINKIERILGYTFKNKQLLIQAFLKQPIEITEPDGSTMEINNDSLEFIGDRILYSIITINYTEVNMKKCSNGFIRLPRASSFSKYVMKHSTNEKWLNIMNTKHIKNVKNWLVVGNNVDLKVNNLKSSKVFADLFEAIFGALAIDCNYDMNQLRYSFNAVLVRKHGCGLLKLIESSKKTAHLDF